MTDTAPRIHTASGWFEEEFHAERLTGVGSSDAAPALGLSPWATPYDKWLEKIGESKRLPQTEEQYFGNLFQDLILDEYSRRTGHFIGRHMPMIRHPDHTWMITHLDARVLGNGDRLVEAKNSYTDRGWGEPGTDQIPQYYLVQCQHSMIVAEAQVCDVPVLFGGNRFAIYEVRADPSIAAALIDAERAFWQLVLDRTPPPPVNTEDAVRRWGKRFNPGDVFATEADMEEIAILRDCRAEIKRLEERQDAAKTEIMQRLSDLGDTLVDLAGTPLATWKLDNGRKGYTVEPREPARRFLLKE